MSKKQDKIDIDKFTQDSVSVEKTIYQQINDIKTTIIKMFINRGFINEENKERYTQKLISDDNDDMEYMINIDNDSNYNTTIKNKKIYIKILNYGIISINKSSPINAFLVKHEKDYKFIVVKDINAKSEDMILSYNSLVEVYLFDKLKFDITEHILSPRYEILTQTKNEELLETYRAKKRDLPFIKNTDAAAKYYNAKPGEIIRIIRPSPLTCESVFYRIVIKSKDTNAKT